MSKNSPISAQDSALFGEEVSGVKPFSHDTIHPVRKPIKQKLQHREQQSKRDAASFHFSDDFVPVYTSEDPLAYRRDDEPSQTLKQLRRGLFHPDLVLDLHGLTLHQAQQEISALINAAQREHAECICIIHGIGERILKRQTPRWLVQHPSIRAFHQATKEWGGKGAIIAVLEVTERGR